MPELTSVGRQVARTFSGVLRKIGVFPKRYEPAVQNKVRAMALDSGTMHIQSVPQLLAEEFASDLKRLIEQQAFAWVPLSPGYAKRKQMLGLDPRILIATGRYMRAIRVVQDAKGAWTVGIPPWPLHAGSRYTLQDLARWLEFGTRTMPARPHWRPAMAMWKTKSYQAKLGLRHGVRTYLRRRGFR